MIVANYRDALDKINWLDTWNFWKKLWSKI